MSESLLDIRDLSVDYITDTGPVRAIDHLDLAVERGEIIGVAGEVLADDLSVFPNRRGLQIPDPVVAVCQFHQNQQALARGYQYVRQGRGLQSYGLR